MRRGANGTDALETINAAATAIASGETRGSHASVQKRRWGSFWSLYWCFGWNKNNKRIGHVASETSARGITDASTPEYSSQQTSVLLPFVAPPSSPASFFLSEPPSATQSPTGILSMNNNISANIIFSPGPPSMFAIGPYAHETQLVSPPVFSTFTTEPSTAPYTPQMTTPSSPEVPFAICQKYPFSNQYEFQSYQLQPGSPVSHLISPSSGTCSPFPNLAPNLLDLDRILSSEHTGVEMEYQKNRTITLGSTKEFNFENVEGGGSDEPSISSSEWWVNEKVVAAAAAEEGGGHSKNWSFFPMMQTGVS